MLAKWRDISEDVVAPTHRLGDTPYTVEQRLVGDRFRFFAYYGPARIGRRDGFQTETQAKVACEIHAARSAA